MEPLDLPLVRRWLVADEDSGDEVLVLADPDNAQVLDRLFTEPRVAED